MPEPEGSAGVISELRRTAMSAQVDGYDVLYQFDEAGMGLRACVRVTDERLFCSDLLDGVGRVAISAEFGEGEVIVYGDDVELGTAPDQALALRAIPHIYAALRDPRERKALRALHHRLSRAPAARL